MIGNHLDNCLLMARSMLRELIPVIFVNRTQWQLFIRRRFMDKKRSAVSYYTARLKTGQSEANVWVINAIDKREKMANPPYLRVKQRERTSVVAFIILHKPREDAH